MAKTKGLTKKEKQEAWKRIRKAEAEVLAKERREAAQLRIYRGRYFVAGKTREKAEDLAGKVSDREEKIILLNPQKETTLAVARRSVVRGRKPLRVTPKRPKLRR